MPTVAELIRDDHVGWIARANNLSVLAIELAESWRVTLALGASRDQVLTYEQAFSDLYQRACTELGEDQAAFKPPQQLSGFVNNLSGHDPGGVGEIPNFSRVSR